MRSKTIVKVLVRKRNSEEDWGILKEEKSAE